MELLKIVWRDYRWAFVAVMMLSLASAGLGIVVIAFINQRLLDTFADPWRVLPLGVQRESAGRDALARIGQLQKA